MPQVVLVALILAVAPYILLAGAAALGFMATRREDRAPESDEPTVSILVDSPSTSPDESLHSTLESSYPDGCRDRIEEILQIQSDASDDRSLSEETDLRVRSVRVEDPTPGETHLDACLRRGLETARGEVLLVTTADCEVPPNWIPSMVRRCTPTTPIVVGPTLVEHDDLFLPRLEALHRVGAFALVVGLQKLGLRLPALASNLALRSDQETDLGTVDDSPCLFDLREERAVYTSESEAAVRCSPASSFLEYLQRQARTIRRVARRGAWSLQTALAGLWLAHTLLLACCLVAVLLPAWRQPTLLALLGKMGADALLSVPAARHYGQRTLTRSLVPSELMFLITIPIAGPWSLANFSAGTNLRPRKPRCDK